MEPNKERTEDVASVISEDVIEVATATIDKAVNENGKEKKNEITKFEDVKKVTTEEYFNNNQFSVDAFNKKYAAKKENGEIETYVEALKRVCDYLASAEKTEKERKYWAERWFDEIYNDWWQPAGSIMQGANSKRNISMANCTTISLGSIDDGLEWDNLESIIKNTAYTVAKTAAFRQGLGVDFSKIRPKGTRVLNSANESSGAIHWMKFIDSIGYYVGQSGRVPAFLFSLSINHPDVEDFIEVKSDYTKIQNANISVQIGNDFYKKVEKDEDWDMVFEIPATKIGDKIYVDVHSITKDCLFDNIENKHYYIATKDKKGEKIKKTTSARKILELIAKNMCKNAEPGIQNIDIARKYSNSDYVYDPADEYDSRILSTNACSEQYLSRESLCVLASINLGRFSVEKEKYDTELDTIGHSVNRFLDNVNEMELRDATYATPHQRMAIERLRRTGAGYTNIGAWLFKQNLEYGSTEANEKIEDFTKVYNYYLYKSSIELGKEKGNFGMFDKEKLEKSPFIKRMVKEFPDLEFDTLRNVTVSSIAPTGCGVKETEILTSEGKKTYEQIFNENGVNIKELRGEKKWIDVTKNMLVNNIDGSYKKITKLFYNGDEDPVFSIELSSGEVLKFTGEHKLLIESKTNSVGDWKRVLDLTKDDKIIRIESLSELPYKYKTETIVETNIDYGVQTFDIEVEGSHYYILSNGVISHNTLSLMFRDSIMSYGIEPAFDMYYWKRTRISGKYEYYFCVPNVVRDTFKKAGYEIPINSDTVKDTWDGEIGRPVVEFIEKHKNKLGIKFKNATEISPLDKLELMSRIMKWVDSSISVTYLLPEGSKWKDVYNFILEAYRKEVKSVAAFPDKKMYGIISFVPFKDLAVKLIAEGTQIHHQNFNNAELKELNISKESISVDMKEAPKRLKELEADINIVTVKGDKFIIVTGLQNGTPYEMFGGHLGNLKFKFNYKKGKIIKIESGLYQLEIGDDIMVEDFSKQFNPFEQLLFRMISTSLRHGIPIKFIMEQLNKSTEDLTSTTSAAVRILKKYVVNGEKVSGGSKCPSCSSNELVYIDGCVTCAQCSWSKC